MEVMAGVETVINAMRSQLETAGSKSLASPPWSYSFSPAHAFAQHSRGQAHRCLILLWCVPIRAEESQAEQTATKADEKEEAWSEEL